MSRAARKRPRPRYQRSLFWVTFWGIAALFVGYCINQSEAFTHCVKARKHADKYQALYQSGSVIGAPIIRDWTRFRIVLACTGDFTSVNQGSLVAIATIALSMFTFTLWRSTNRLWRSSERHADQMERSVKVAEQALQNVERAFVFPKEIKTVFPILIPPMAVFGGVLMLYGKIPGARLLAICAFRSIGIWKKIECRLLSILPKILVETL